MYEKMGLTHSFEDGLKMSVEKRSAGKRATIPN
jgi:hypothetical protein